MFMKMFSNQRVCSLIVLVNAFVKFCVMNGFVLCTCWSITSNWHQSTFLWRNAEYIKTCSATSCQMLESGLFLFSFYHFFFVQFKCALEKNRRLVEWILPLDRSFYSLFTTQASLHIQWREIVLHTRHTYSFKWCVKFYVQTVCMI
jgi:hypothetical protein